MQGNPKEVSTPERKVSLYSARILVVEDEFLISLQLADILSNAGATVIGPAANVHSALQLCEEQNISAAVLYFRLGSETSAR